MAKQIVMYATGDTSLARASRAFDARHVQLAGDVAEGRRFQPWLAAYSVTVDL